MTIEQIQDLLSNAIQADLEHGVRHLNELASEEFARKYPEIVKAINLILDIDEEN